jgi:hypothetical protein
MPLRREMSSCVEGSIPKTSQSTRRIVQKLRNLTLIHGERIVGHIGHSITIFLCEESSDPLCACQESGRDDTDPAGRVQQVYVAGSSKSLSLKRDALERFAMFPT